jgi:hypothetical protein
MKSIMYSLLVLMLFPISEKLISQDAISPLDRVYNLDPLLYNGKKYSYFLPPGTGGNQFLFSPDFFTGDVTIKGRRFDRVTLNYDIYNQQLLLQYTNETGSFEIIEISKTWLESFRLGDMEFKYTSFEEGPRFYQVLGNGPICILYYWRKDLKLDASYGAEYHTFTPPIRSRFVLIDNKLRPFTNKRSLISTFDPGLQPQIRNYIRHNKIRLKNASDRAITEMINYIGNL